KEKNRLMREEKADLSGYTALVTGGRIRIGYAVCLRLLRSGARVMAVTRFPYDAWERYKSEPDFEEFKDRLVICGFDLKRVDRIGELIELVKETFPQGLDILINNAAQTIRKAPSYYLELTENERRLGDMLTDGGVYGVTDMNGMSVDSEGMGSVIRLTDVTAETAGNLPVPFEKSGEICEYETPNHNSWVAKAEEISPAEMLEVQLINVTAPFLLVGQLKSHMAKSPHRNKFIINVSSVEGRFNKKKKLARHVHTNMAKASINMMTHSLSGEYAAAGIYIYSVDPGWVSNQFPAEYEVTKAFEPYLSYEDGAARICYPVWLHLNDEKKPPDAGALYKDFKTEEF
ncbi:MAG: SDR family oxidoreductase, partial [Ruminococcus sp.]|nr:SDR family oxidoreductase [Ruminococcus sp.]